MTKFIFGSFLLFYLAIGCKEEKTAANLLAPTEFQQAWRQNPNAVLVDIRTPEEYQTGHIAKSENVNWSDANFMTQIEQKDKTKPIFLYCEKGGRSAAAVEKLTAAGFQKIYELKGGMEAWRNANLPME